MRDAPSQIHILGICGTFMGGLALLARELGMSVSGADQGIYPPMSEQLAAAVPPVASKSSTSSTRCP